MIKKRFLLVAVLLFAITLNYSCKKETEDVIDCLFDGAYYNVSHTIDTLNTKKVTLEVSYSGEHTLDNSIKWDFGDGHTQTINGTTAEHTYIELGTYTVKANVTTRNGDAYCSHELEETVNIN